MSFTDILTGLGAMFGMADSQMQGDAQAQAAQYNAAIARQNAELARRQAKRDEQLQRIKADQETGALRASYGASGVSMEGSPTHALAASAMAAELDAQMIRYGGQVRAGRFEAEAALEEQRAATARAGGTLGSVSSLLSGTSAMLRSG